MKNRKLIKEDPYRHMKNKIFIRTALMMVAAFVTIYLLYTYLLRGRFGNWVVRFLEWQMNWSNERALDFYQQTFRNYMEIFLLLAIIIVFFILLRIYLNKFAKYFYEINSGLDAMLNEDGNDVSFSPELSATEKKINTIKHTLSKRKADTQLAEQRKNDLIVYLAHDLKTPLTSVIGYLTLLRDENQISEELREKYLSISLDKAERLEDLINEFFEITRFNLSNIPLEYSKINLNRLLEQLLYEFRPMLQEKNLTCTLHIASDIMLRCDADKMQRVLDNLLRNAVYYSFEDSEIVVTATEQNKLLTLTFLNQGNTVPPEKLDRIFEQFYRLDTSRRSNNGGAGLGLAIAKEIVELHQGTIAASSYDEKIIFTITLPLS